MESRLRVCKTKCKSQFCPDCCMAHCVTWREKLRPALKHWNSVMMLTLTLDQTKFDSPWDALETVGKKRAVSELIKELNRVGLLKSREFTCTIEFHKNGWPHYHVLVDCKFLCKHKLQAKWKRGNCWISKHDFKSVEHAINYATKYIVKTTKADENEFIFPEWVMDYKGNVRRFSTSRGLCPTRKYKKNHGDGKKRTRITKTGREKIAT